MCFDKKNKPTARDVAVYGWPSEVCGVDNLLWCHQGRRTPSLLDLCRVYSSFHIGIFSCRLKGNNSASGSWNLIFFCTWQKTTFTAFCFFSGNSTILKYPFLAVPPDLPPVSPSIKLPGPLSCLAGSPLPFVLFRADLGGQHWILMQWPALWRPVLQSHREKQDWI